MPTFVVYLDWLATAPVNEASLASISKAWRPDDESVCIWATPARPDVLRISVELEAADYQDAIRIGRDYVDEARQLGGLLGVPSKVTAETEEGHATWQPDPGETNEGT